MNHSKAFFSLPDFFQKAFYLDRKHFDQFLAPYQHKNTFMVSKDNGAGKGSCYCPSFSASSLVLELAWHGNATMPSAVFFFGKELLTCLVTWVDLFLAILTVLNESNMAFLDLQVWTRSLVSAS